MISTRRLRPLSSAALSGPLHIAQPIQITWGDQGTTIDRLDAQVTYDGRDLSLASLELAQPEGDLFIDGRVTSILDGPALDLSYRADLILGRAAAWWRPDHGVDGHAVANGTVTGPVDAPSVSVEMETSDLQWGKVSELAVRATARLEPGAFVVDSAAVTHGDGTLDGSA